MTRKNVVLDSYLSNGDILHDILWIRQLHGQKIKNYIKMTCNQARFVKRSCYH
jgi:hypothetical protein